MIIKEDRCFDDKKLVVVHTPNFPNGQRADTGRTVKYAYLQNKDIFSNDAKVLVISSQPFTRNQRTVTKQNLPKGINLDVTGEGITSARSIEAQNKLLMMCVDSLARTVHARYEHIRENEMLRAIILDKSKKL